MTEPLQKPPRKNPQRRTVLPTLPPFSRSRKAMAFSAAAARAIGVVRAWAVAGIGGDGLFYEYVADLVVTEFVGRKRSQR